MKTEDLIVDERRQRKEVEKVGKVFPNVRVAVLAQTFIVEAINLRDLTGLMIAAKDGDTLRESNFERH